MYTDNIKEKQNLGNPKILNSNVCQADSELECLTNESYEKFVMSNEINICNKGCIKSLLFVI